MLCICMPHHHCVQKALQLTSPSVQLDLVAVMIKSKVTGVPDTCALPGNLLTLNRISMHIADFLSYKNA